MTDRSIWAARRAEIVEALRTKVIPLTMALAMLIETGLMPDEAWAQAAGATTSSTSLGASTNTVGTVILAPGSATVGSYFALQAGNWTMGLSAGSVLGLSAGANTIGSALAVQSGNWTQGLSAGSVVGLSTGSNTIGSAFAAQLGNWAVGLSAGSVIGLSTGSNTVGSMFAAELGNWTIGLSASSVIGLSTGANTIGSVFATIVGVPAVSQSGNWSVGLSAASVIGLSTGANTIGSAFSLQNSAWTVGLSAASVIGLSTGSNTIGSAFAVQSGNWAVSLSASQTIGLVAGTANIGLVVPTGGLAAGNTPISKQVANNTTSVAISTSATTLYHVEAYNNGGATAYLKLYDNTQGSVTCGVGTPVYRQEIPAGNTAIPGIGAGFVSPHPMGLKFVTALTSCVTTGFADNDSAAPAASTYIIDFDVK